MVLVMAGVGKGLGLLGFLEIAAGSLTVTGLLQFLSSNPDDGNTDPSSTKTVWLKMQKPFCAQLCAGHWASGNSMLLWEHV